MLINAPTIDKFEPMHKMEVDGIIAQINGAFEQGVPPEEMVSFPTFVLARLLRTIQHLETLVPAPDPNQLDSLLDGMGEAQEAKEEK